MGGKYISHSLTFSQHLPFNSQSYPGGGKSQRAPGIQSTDDCLSPQGRKSVRSWKRVGHSSAGLASPSLSTDAHVFSVLAPLSHQPDENTPTSSHLDADRKTWLPRNDANLLVSSFPVLPEDLKRARLSDCVPLIHSSSREFSSSLPEYIDDAGPNTFFPRENRNSKGR